MSLPETLFTISPSNDSTIVLEVLKTGLMRRRKHHLFFDNFRGELRYMPDRPESSRVNITIDAASVTCRDQWLKKKKQQAVTRYAKNQILEADRHPEITFTSTRISLKPLRGFVVEGVLKVRGIGRTVKLNIVLNPMKNERFQIDGDASIHLPDFGVKPHSSLFGLIG
ncbi:MAG: YceI family protein, partial [Bryobacteraceae bacterium]